MTVESSPNRTSSADAAIDRYCLKDDLRTYDPFDVWQTSLGFHTKDLRNRYRGIGFVPAGVLTVLDGTINNKLRLFYSRREYPIVRALAALTLLNAYQRRREPHLLEFSKRHLKWLLDNSCHGYSGPCWGLGFRYAVDAGLVYEPNTPLSTMTPYALEAFITYTRVGDNDTFLHALPGIYRFFENDIKTMEETEDYLVTSYAPIQDRRVINAVSYTLYSLSILQPYIDESRKEAAATKILKLYNYVQRTQQSDGSWWYSPDERSFIDCFHSCIILKNLLKTQEVFELPNSREIVERGYKYIKENFFVAEDQLFKRFTVTHTPALVRYDLYDNAEMLNLAKLMHDDELVDLLAVSMQRSFVSESDIYSQIDRFGIRRNKNMLRWAVMPYLYAISWDP